ncbi:Calcium/calmodulin-dependent protein kinase type I [Trametes pubescens]|uniref:Calcium/calmodulin-dependent protein kinase type I n=1 Tax=Trametes pubescens TaxID=154538 RepID=A0A1M2V7U3_TRAPU|nr:Calcium/calmodulin-dependent protein kinase type I [Trametes pubescens]
MGSQVSKHRSSRGHSKEGQARHQDSDESALQGEQYASPAVRDSRKEMEGGRAALAAHRSPGTWASSAQTLSTPASPAAPSPPRPPHGLPGADTALHDRAQAGAGPGGRREADQSNEKYRTGKTLGSGTYAIVKEAVHIKTGEYFACKVINKKLMEGREYMVRNEIAVLKKISKGHTNIVTLHDYFETAHNLYLVFDLCTGGELFDRICAKGNYYEEDAAALVRTIFGAVKYIHECGIVHRDLKPENLIFRTKAEDADIMIADFGLSRVMDDEKFQMLTEICGTPGYMAPEIFKKTGHGKPVDVWAMGVITYFLLCGYTPFDRDTQQQEMEAIIAGDYHFEPEEYWANVSDTAKDFVRMCLTIDPTSRPTAAEMLGHKWLASDQRHFVPDPASPSGGPTNLLPHIQKAFDAKKTFRKAVFSMIATKRMSSLAGLSPTAQRFGQNIAELKEESEKEHVDEDRSVTHYGESESSRDELKKVDDVSQSEASGQTPLVKQMAKVSI